MIITIISSLRFKKEIEKKTKELSLQGHIVLAPVFCSEQECLNHKNLLIDLHKAKINISDKVFVININGYIEDSDRIVIDYAIKTHTKVEYMVAMQDRFVNQLTRGQIINKVIYKGNDSFLIKSWIDLLYHKEITSEPMLYTEINQKVQVQVLDYDIRCEVHGDLLDYEISFEVIVL